MVVVTWLDPNAGAVSDPGYMGRQIRKFRTDKFDSETNVILTHATHVNGWFPAAYTSCMSQNFGLFHVSNLSVRNFQICLSSVHVSGTLTGPV